MPGSWRSNLAPIRASATDVIINLTAGMGGDFELGETDPKLAGPNTKHRPASGTNPSQRAQNIRNK